jgi:hypothetical protein
MYEVGAFIFECLMDLLFEIIKPAQTQGKIQRWRICPVAGVGTKTAFA